MLDSEITRFVKSIGINTGISDNYTFVILKDNHLAVYDGKIYAILPLEFPYACAVQAKKFLTLIDEAKSLSMSKDNKKVIMKGASFTSTFPIFDHTAAFAFFDDYSKAIPINCNENFINALRTTLPFTDKDYATRSVFTILSKKYCYSNSGRTFMRMEIAKDCNITAPLYLSDTMINKLLLLPEPAEVRVEYKTRSLWLRYKNGMKVRCGTLSIYAETLPSGLQKVESMFAELMKKYKSLMTKTKDKKIELSDSFFSAVDRAAKIWNLEQDKIQHRGNGVYLQENKVFTSLDSHDRSEFYIEDFNLHDIYQYSPMFLRMLKASSSEGIQATFFKFPQQEDRLGNVLFFQGSNKCSGFIAGFMDV